MKKIGLIFSIYYVFSMLFINSEVAYASMRNILFRQLLVNTESTLMEYGLKFTWNTDNNNKIECLKILKNIGIDESGYKIDISQNETMHSINFQSEDRYGQIESYSNNLSDKISLEIIEKGDKLAIEQLEHKLRRRLNLSSHNITVFRYLKAKSNISNISSINEIVIKELIENNAKHIESISLDNSLSITALTGYYEKTKNGYTNIDFNCAVCSYESGNYLIIGTPIIMKSY
jgi:hypothetical protein